MWRDFAREVCHLALHPLRAHLPPAREPLAARLPARKYVSGFLKQALGFGRYLGIPASPTEFRDDFGGRKPMMSQEHVAKDGKGDSTKCRKSGARNSLVVNVNFLAPQESSPASKAVTISPFQNRLS